MNLQQVAASKEEEEAPTTDVSAISSPRFAQAAFISPLTQTPEVLPAELPQLEAAARHSGGMAADRREDKGEAR